MNQEEDQEPTSKGKRKRTNTRATRKSENLASQVEGQDLPFTFSVPKSYQGDIFFSHFVVIVLIIYDKFLWNSSCIYISQYYCSVCVFVCVCVIYMYLCVELINNSLDDQQNSKRCWLIAHQPK